MGGLGNQLFQYAIGKQLAHHQKTDLKLDLSFFSNLKNATPRTYKLGYFNISAEFATNNDITHVLGEPLFRPIKRRLWKMGLDLFHWNYVTENGNKFQSEIPAINYPVFLHGYWQNENYFSSIRPILLKELQLKNEFLTTKLRSQCIDVENVESVAIHVRRGDYLSHTESSEMFHTCSVNYYVEAIKLIKSKLKSPQFFIFSDDLDWCKNNLSLGLVGNSVRYITGNTDYEDLKIMSSCKHQIIANSSFSWWSAWLNVNENKTVIAPEKWYKNEEQNQLHTLPNDWIKL